MTNTQNDAAEAMRIAAQHLRDSAESAAMEAEWIERNELGRDAEYLRASLASREGEVRRGARLALTALENVVVYNNGATSRTLVSEQGSPAPSVDTRRYPTGLEGPGWSPTDE